MPLTFAYWTFAICIIYMFFLLSQKRYRLLIPSVIHTLSWGITALIIILQIKGIFMFSQRNEGLFSHSAEYMFYIVLSSIVGFILAHCLTEKNTFPKTTDRIIDTIVIGNVLKKFQWVPYLCAAIGITLLVYLISILGNIDTYSDYREIAIHAKKTGMMAVVQRVSGHVNILGTFYLMLLGYKMGKEGINLKNLVLNMLLCSLINMSIGGRVWILTSTIPFFSTYILSRHYSQLDNRISKSDNKKALSIILAAISLFAILGILRSDSSSSHHFMDKFGYFTDGMRITNIVLTQFPINSFDLEYGRSEFLSLWIGSPMADKFSELISNDIGLSVTVESSLPSLYYDYGFIGGIIMWGVFCFIIEYFCIRLKRSNTIIGILLFGQLSQMLFQAPIFPIFSLNTPSFEWILLLYIFRRYIFGNCRVYER